MPNLVPGTGNPNAKLLILGEAPGSTENRQGKPFVGAPGELLDRIFTELGMSNWRTECWVTNVYKYQPPYNDIKRIGEVTDKDSQKEYLINEILSVNPNCILALGATALEAVTGYTKILQYRGSILPTQIGEGKVVPSIHPAVLVRASNESGDDNPNVGLFSYVWKWVLQSDIKRAIEESNSKRFYPVGRNLIIARDSVSVSRFLEKGKHKDHFFADIETIECTIPGCISIAWDKYEAISIPLFQRVKNIELTTIPTTDLASIWQKLDKLFREKKVGGQNWKFDQQKLELLGFKFKGLHSDTSLKAHTVNPEIPKVGLAFLSSIWTREPYYKDEGKEFIFGKHSIDRWYLYNAKDSAVDCEVDDSLNVELQVLSDIYKTDLVSFYNNYINELHQIYFDIEKVGFRLDDGVRGYLIAKYQTWAEHLEVQLEAAIGREVNFNSPKQVKELLYEQMRLKPVDKAHSTGEDAIAKILKRGVNDGYARVLSNILEYRRVKKTLSTYLYAAPDIDGRMRTQFRITGTETGRSSTSVLDEPTRPVQVGFAFQTITKHGDIGSDIREMLIADEGHVLVNIDLSQAEARVVAVLAEDWELLSAFDRIDIHRRTAALALITGKLNLGLDFDPIADIIGKDSAERFIGKKTRHAGNYNMKWPTFMTSVISDCRRFGIDFTISKYSAEQILNRFHEASPKIKNVFHAQVIQAVDASRALINPFGRLRRFFDRPGEALHREAFAFIPQSTVKDRLMQSLMKIRKAGGYVKYKVRCNNEAHDALTFLMRIDEHVDICREFKPLMQLPINFGGCTLSRDIDLIIPCDFEVGQNYKELKKLKL